MVLENLLGHLRDRPWWKVGDVYLLASNHYDPTRERLDIDYTFVSNGASRCGTGHIGRTRIGSWSS